MNATADRTRARLVVEITPGIRRALARLVERACRERWTRAQLDRAGRRLARHCWPRVRVLGVVDGTRR